MYRVKIKNIASWLQDSFLYKELDKEDEEEEIMVPHYKETTYINNVEDLILIYKTANYFQTCLPVSFFNFVRDYTEESVRALSLLNEDKLLAEIFLYIIFNQDICLHNIIGTEFLIFAHDEILLTHIKKYSKQINLYIYKDMLNLAGEWNFDRGENLSCINMHIWNSIRELSLHVNNDSVNYVNVFFNDKKYYIEHYITINRICYMALRESKGSDMEITIPPLSFKDFYPTLLILKTILPVNVNLDKEVDKWMRKRNKYIYDEYPHVCIKFNFFKEWNELYIIDLKGDGKRGYMLIFDDGEIIYVYDDIIVKTRDAFFCIQTLGTKLEVRKTIYYSGQSCYVDYILRIDNFYFYSVIE
jgi:hypothetical protein